MKLIVVFIGALFFVSSLGYPAGREKRHTLSNTCVLAGFLFHEDDTIYYADQLIRCTKYGFFFPVTEEVESSGEVVRASCPVPSCLYPYEAILFADGCEKCRLRFSDRIFG